MNIVFLSLVAALFGVTVLCAVGMAFDPKAQCVRPWFATPDRLRIYATVGGCSVFLSGTLAIIYLTGNFPVFGI